MRKPGKAARRRRRAPESESRTDEIISSDGDSTVAGEIDTPTGKVWDAEDDERITQRTQVPRLRA